MDAELQQGEQLINGAAIDQLAPGQVKIELSGHLSGEHVIIDSRKLTRRMMVKYQKAVAAVDALADDAKTDAQLANNDAVIKEVVVSFTMTHLKIVDDSWSEDWPMHEYREFSNAIWARLNEYIVGPKEQTSKS